MELEEKCSCGKPLNDYTRCKCEPVKCYNCCTCPPDCECGCIEKRKKDEEQREEK